MTKYLPNIFKSTSMRTLKQEIYFPIIIGLHLILWVIDIAMYQGDSMEIRSAIFFFFDIENVSYINPYRILGEILSSWVVTVFAANFLMATRAKWVERIFGGLDKMYLIHRRSGVIAVVLLILHYMIVPRDYIDIVVGKLMGFFALVLILLGVIISAVPIFKRKIKYNKWLNIHKLMGLFYVLGVAHSFFVNTLTSELPLVRVYVYGMALIGTIAWVYRAFLFNVFNKKLDYKITEVKNLGHQVTEVVLKPIKKDLQYLAGQFAFFKFPSISKQEQHPFTLSSHPYDNMLRITVKGLGDYTDDLKSKLIVGDSALVEGPYGHFSSSYIKEYDQIWIAGGIGITPFLSLAKDLHPNKVQLYWCVNKKEEAVYVDELQEIVNNNPNIQFTIWSSDESGYLTADKLDTDNFKNKGYLICGPNAMKESLTKGLLQKGVNRGDIYDEEFAFR